MGQGRGRRPDVMSYEESGILEEENDQGMQVGGS